MRNVPKYGAGPGPGPPRRRGAAGLPVGRTTEVATRGPAGGHY